MKPSCRVAIVHDYLNQMGGAERVVELLHRMFPEAPIYTTIVDRDRLWPELREADIRVSWMQRIPGVLRFSKALFWLYPLAVRSWDLRGYDLVISSSSAYAKGARVPEGTVHICYCHTPMRFAWNFQAYMEAADAPGILKAAARWMMGPLRRWDRRNSARVDLLVANSSVVQRRIRDYYGLPSVIVHPPVNLGRFQTAEPEEAGDELLVVSRLVAYKRIDLAVEACTRTGRKLTVIGDGPDRKRLEAMAGPTVRFLGRLPDDQVVRHMRTCKALLFPGLEDFGITPLEANACGRPVVAYRGGGALDTVKPMLSGVFFERQTAESLIIGLNELDRHRWNPALIRKHAEQFGEDAFVRGMRRLIEVQLNDKERRHETRIAVRRFG
jgi:glycosyltransferase involved in cell wall biosynthesis